MPTSPSEYRRAVQAARQRLGALQTETLRNLRRDLDRFEAQLIARLGSVDPNRTNAAVRIVRGMYRQLDQTISATTAAGRAATYDEVLALWEEAQARLAKVQGIPLKTLGAVPLPRTALAGAYDAFGAAGTWRTLLTSHARASAAEADMIVRQAIGAGVRPDELARELRPYVAGSEYFDEFFRRSGDRLKLDLRELEAAGVKGAAGRMVHNSRRIAFTEQTNARIEAEVQHWVRDPFTEAVLWETAPDRGSLIPPDECDVFATEDFYGLGPGIFPVHQVPGSPHPWDRCDRTPIPPEELGKPKPLPSRKLPGDRARIPGTVSDARAQAIRGNVERVLTNTEAVDFSAILGEAAAGTGGAGTAIFVPPGLRRRAADEVEDAAPAPTDIPEGPAPVPPDIPEELVDPYGWRDNGLDVLTVAEAGRGPRPPFPTGPATLDEMEALGWRVERRKEELFPGTSIPQSRYVHDETGRATNWLGGDIAKDFADPQRVRILNRQREILEQPYELAERIEKIRNVPDPPSFASADEAADWVAENLDGVVAGLDDFPEEVRQGLIEELVEVARERPIIAYYLRQLDDGANRRPGGVRGAKWSKHKNTYGLAYDDGVVAINPTKLKGAAPDNRKVISNGRRDMTGTAAKQQWKFDGPKPEYNSWTVSRSLTKEWDEARDAYWAASDAEKRRLDRYFNALSARSTLRHELGHNLDHAYRSELGRSFVPIKEFQSGGEFSMWAPGEILEDFLDYHRRRSGGLEEFAHDVSVYGTTNKAEMVAEAFEGIGPRGNPEARNNPVVRGIMKIFDLFDPQKLPLAADEIRWADLDSATRANVKRRVRDIMDEIGLKGKAWDTRDAMLRDLPD